MQGASFHHPCFSVPVWLWIASMIQVTLHPDSGSDLELATQQIHPHEFLTASVTKIEVLVSCSEVRMRFDNVTHLSVCVKWYVSDSQ